MKNNFAQISRKWNPGDIVEITGKVDQAGLNINEKKRANGRLRICEIEFYEPVTE